MYWKERIPKSLKDMFSLTEQYTVVHGGPTWVIVKTSMVDTEANGVNTLKLSLENQKKISCVFKA